MYKTLYPCEVEKYVKLNYIVRMLDKEDGEVCSVGTRNLDDKWIINCLNDKADRYYFWAIGRSSDQ